MSLLRPDDGHRHRDHRRRLRRGRGRRAARPRARRACRATSYCLVGAIGHDFYDGRARGRARASRASPTRACAATDGYADYLRMADRAQPGALRRRRASTCCCCTTPTAPATRARPCGRAWRALRDAGPDRALLGVAPGPANGFTLDLIDCFERFGDADRLGDDHPQPARAVAGRARARRGRARTTCALITRVVDYGGLFHDDVAPGPRLRRARPPQLPPRGLGRGRARAARAHAPDRRAPRPHAAAARVRSGTSPTPPVALRRADADPGAPAPARARSRTSAPSWPRCRAEPLLSAERGRARSARSATTRGCMALKGARARLRGRRAPPTAGSSTASSRRWPRAGGSTRSATSSSTHEKGPALAGPSPSDGVADDYLRIERTARLGRVAAGRLQTLGVLLQLRGAAARTLRSRWSRSTRWSPSCRLTRRHRRPRRHPARRRGRGPGAAA